ncbi:MAG: helix-hairpin-helix domain-containing protein [bacterium]|nr:MAG: helix-hairpin-helix domain-containing protein [bacterium]
MRFYLTRPFYPQPGAGGETWPPHGSLVDATALIGRAMEVFPPGTTVPDALERLTLVADTDLSGVRLPRAGVLVRSQGGWRIRPMTQAERWVWRIPMALHDCEPADLERIEGIGPALAVRIYDHVRTAGHLDSIRELKAVPGVGPARVRTLEEALELPLDSRRPNGFGELRGDTHRPIGGGTTGKSTMTVDRMRRKR